MSIKHSGDCLECSWTIPENKKPVSNFCKNVLQVVYGVKDILFMENDVFGAVLELPMVGF